MADFTYRTLSLDSYFDKIFYINLRKDTDRDKNMRLQFDMLSIKNYERIEAVEINSLDNISPAAYRNFNIKEARYVLGSISCRASHLKCVHAAITRGYQRILILEDDAVFLQNPDKLLTQNTEILNDWDMLYFGGDPEPHFRNQIVNAHAYGIKSSLFENILFMAEPSGMEIDNFYAKIIQHMSYNDNQSGKYNIRIILPFNQIVQNKNLKSNIRG